ncbi:M60 family metallopeptidase [Akkermansia sp. N21116]|uniref:M60 family metallopeptidase n=1 Tax=Akkermansia sp. N21116 TaxID=3040764 RepID=UPI00244E7A3B|nr:M60 family metallopeptidase [Akkermansia sp. N21116]WPX41469.1 M60 family metallopeptidase [Akkermansia sp. N21116]
MNALSLSLIAFSFCTLCFAEPGVSTNLSGRSPAMASATPEDAFHKNFRTQVYEAYQPLKSLASQLKTGTYNQYENPTGIYFQAGDTIIVNVATDIGEESPRLLIMDFGPDGKGKKDYPLKTGENKITAEVPGLGYISYYSDHYKTAPKLKITIQGGKANGYFDPVKHSNREWKKLLAEAVSPILDIKGRKIQLAFPVQALKEQCPDNGLELIGLYDRIVALEHNFMGLGKYKRTPKNRMFARVIWKGYMYADGIGAAFNNNTMRKVANVDNIKANSWGIAHELGHVNQVRPGFKWVCTTETTNNLYSLWISYNFAKGKINQEARKAKDWDGNKLIGGGINCYLHAALIAGEQWLCQRGPDRQANYEFDGDHGSKLLPLWQLHQYFNIAAMGNRDFYGDILERIRTSNDKGLSDGDHQLNFMKYACDVSKKNLTPFFKAVGMLKPIDKRLIDYRKAQLTITQEQCDAIEAYAKRYPLPASPVIYYISSGTTDFYKKRLAVKGLFNQGITEQGRTRTINHDIWKNAVAFETYAGEELTHIAVWGTNSEDKSSTLVQYPEGSTRIEAVSWDGKRTLVTGTRPTQSKRAPAATASL